MRAQDFIDAARSLKGARWRHRGRRAPSPTDKGVIDCIGVLALSFQLGGGEFKDAKDYGREPHDDRLREELTERFGKPLPASQVQPGDILLMRFGAGEPSHVGIVANHPDGGLSVIHSRQIHGVIEQSLTGPIKLMMIEVFRPTWDEAA